MGGLKRNCRDRSFNQLSHHQGPEIDEGDYAMLRGGKNVLTKHQLPSDGDYEEHQVEFLIILMQIRVGTYLYNLLDTAKFETRDYRIVYTHYYVSQVLALSFFLCLVPSLALSLITH